MMKIPTKQRPQDCLRHVLDKKQTAFPHICAYYGTPCKLYYVIDSCPDYQPKEKKDDGRTDYPTNN